jgi:hypothetical protein
MSKLHLNVIQGPQGTQAAQIASGRRNEFVWKHNFAAFRIVPLPYWDDASYAAYQARDCYEGEDGEDSYGGATAPVVRVEAPAAPVADDDSWINEEIPF